MEQDNQSLKQQIQDDYNKTVGTLGQRVYQLFVPYVEVLTLLQKTLNLNQRMASVLQAEREQQKQKLELKTTPSEVAPIPLATNPENPGNVSPQPA